MICFTVLVLEGCDPTRAVEYEWDGGFARGRAPTSPDAEIVTSPHGDAEPPPPRSFVTRCGTRFCLEGAEYRFTGVNFYDAAGDGERYYCGPVYEDMNRYLDQMLGGLEERAGAKVLRFWAFQSFTNSARDFTTFDRVIRQARRHGFRLMPVLENQWGDCTEDGEKSVEWYRTGYRSPYGRYALSYRDYVAAVVGRYKDDPTILAWMLVNEPESGGWLANQADDSVLFDFTQDISELIKSIAPHQLVALDVRGVGEPAVQREAYLRLHSLPGIDFATGHDYGWDLSPLPGTLGSALPNPDICFDSIACALSRAIKRAGKPFVVSEIGIRTGGTDWSPENRAILMDRKLDAHFSNETAGVVLWHYGGSTDGYDFGIDDPMTETLAKYRYR